MNGYAWKLEMKLCSMMAHSGLIQQKAFFEYFSSTHDIEVLSTKWMEMSLKWKFPQVKIVSHLDTTKIGCEHFLVVSIASHISF